MKKSTPLAISSRILKNLAAPALFLAVSQLNAAVIASDDFSYTSGSALNGASGGTGSWSASWTAASFVTTEDNTAQFGNGSSNTPDGNEMAYRTFDAYSGDVLYVSYELTLSPTTLSGDFFTLWLDSAASVGGTDNHGVSRLNTGVTNGSSFARISSSAARTSTGPTLSASVSYQFVVKYSKSVSGEANKFDTIEWWLNPTGSDYGDPIGTISGTDLSTLLTSISAVGFRGAGNDNGDQFWVDNLTLATEWNDVVIPESATTTYLALMLIVLVGLGRFRRARRS